MYYYNNKKDISEVECHLFLSSMMIKYYPQLELRFEMWKICTRYSKSTHLHMYIMNYFIVMIYLHVLLIFNFTKCDIQFAQAMVLCLNL